MPVEIVSGQVYIQVNALPIHRLDIGLSNLIHQKERTAFIPIRHEDEEFIPRCFYFANQVKHINLTAYHYIQSETSFIQNYKETGFFDYIKAMDSLQQFASKYIKEIPTQQALAKQISSKLLMNLRNSFLFESTIQSEMIKQMKLKHLNPTLHKKQKNL